MAEGYVTIEAGYWVAVVVTNQAAPLRCYAGQVKAVDEHGIRLRVSNWETSLPSNYDFFIPWKNIESALVATSHDDREDFDKEAEKIRDAMMKDMI